VLPGPVQAVARAIPLTYFLEYYRSAYGFGEHSIMTGIVLAVLYLVVGLVILEVSIERARRNGSLLRLSE